MPLGVLILGAGSAVAFLVGLAVQYTAIRSAQPVPPTLLVLSHSVLGNVESCGCGSLKRGGIGRRHNAIQRIVTRPYKVIVIDGGNRFGVPRTPTSEIAAIALRDYFRDYESETMLGLGPTDTQWLGTAGHDMDGVVCLNYSGCARKYASGTDGSIRVSTLIDPSLIEKCYRHKVLSPANALLEFRDSRVSESQVDVVFAYLSPAVKRELQAILVGYGSGIVLIDCSSSAGLARNASEFGDALIIRTEDKGRSLAAIELVEDDERADRAFISEERLDQLDQLKAAGVERIAGNDLARIRGSSIARFRYRVTYMSLTGEYDGPSSVALLSKYRESLGSAVDTSGEAYVDYLGSKRCSACHEREYKSWSSTHHSSAMQTLDARGRQEDVACFLCHVTGASAKVRSGYLAPLPSEALFGVGCEECHGAGALHVLNPLTNRLVRRPTEDTCRRCHTDAINEVFDFEAKLRAASCQSFR